MKDVIIMLTKDAFGKFSLPVYGNTHWKTPNIDELAKNGTVFNRHYTAAPSTIMSFSAALYGYYPYESDNIVFHVKYMNNKKERCFYDTLHEMGYSCHAVFAKGWHLAERAKCFGEHVILHECDNEQKVGPHFNAHNSPFVYDESVAEQSFENIKKTFESIDTSGKTMIWFHIPHVIKGYTGYGSDIEMLDRVVGFLRERYGDDSIFLSADHGHSNHTAGRIGYGFYVYDPEVCIPLITPRLENTPEVNFATSNIDIHKILINREIPKRDYIITDTAFYGQPRRKIGIIKGKYKYIYDKQTDSEELYDLEFDPREDHDVSKYIHFNKDRKLPICASDEYYYPYWDEALKAVVELRKIKDEMYRSASKWTMFKFYLKPYFFKIALKRIKKKIFR